ncbi:hypothetical protein GJ496_002953 [Pomphorhynchus laevis]|nr:hypothetical protein GJ496_002953 [Pomphorhynchus laevis]
MNHYLYVFKDKMSINLSLTFENIRTSLLDSLPVLLIEFLTSGEEYFASCNRTADLWWFLSSTRRLLIYISKGNKCVELPLREAEMDTKLAVNLMTTSIGEDFCCLSTSTNNGNHILSMRYWPKVTKQRYASVYSDWDLIESYDRVPCKLIGNDLTFLAYSSDIFVIFFSLHKASKNEFVPIVHTDSAYTISTTNQPMLSSLTRRLTSMIRNRNAINFSINERDCVQSHLTSENALLSNGQNVFIWKLTDSQTEHFCISHACKIDLSSLFQPCYNEMGLEQNDDVTCVGMQGVNCTLHFLLNSARYKNFLFHSSAVIDNDKISLLSISRIDYSSTAGNIIFSVSSTNRIIMTRNQALITLSFGEKLRDSLSLRVDGQMLCNPVISKNYLWTVEKQHGLCCTPLNPFCYYSDKIWAGFKDIDEKEAMLYSSLCFYMKNEDGQSHQIMNRLVEIADINQVVARFAVAVCDIWTSVENVAEVIDNGELHHFLLVNV